MKKLNKVFFGILIALSGQVIAMGCISPEVISRAPLAGLGAVTNFVGGTAHQYIMNNPTTSWPEKCCRVGFYAAWFSANLQLISSLLYGDTLSAAAGRQVSVAGAAFATNFLGLWLGEKLVKIKTGKIGSIFKNAAIATVATACGFANLAILYKIVTN
jgi:hypothetical protein